MGTYKPQAVGKGFADQCVSWAGTWDTANALFTWERQEVTSSCDWPPVATWGLCHVLPKQKQEGTLSHTFRSLDEVLNLKFDISRV